MSGNYVILRHWGGIKEVTTRLVDFVEAIQYLESNPSADSCKLSGGGILVAQIFNNRKEKVMFKYFTIIHDITSFPWYIVKKENKIMCEALMRLASEEII